MEKILLIGGAGFIGRHLTEKLLSTNKCLVHIIDNLSREDVIKTKVNNNRNNFKFFKFNIDGNLNLKKIRTDYTYIINLAAILGVENVIKNAYETLIKNIKIQNNSIKISKNQKKLKRFIFFSTSEVYRYSVDKKIERVPTSTELDLLLSKLRNRRDSYMISKICGEYLSEYSGLPFTIIRPHNIFGPNMGKRHVIPELIIKMKNSKSIKIVNPNHIRSFCYIDDAVEMIIKIMISNRSKNKIVNVGSNKNIYSIKNLAKKIAFTMKKKIVLDFSNKNIKFNSPRKRIPNVNLTKKITNNKKETNFDNALSKTINSYL